MVFILTAIILLVIFYVLIPAFPILLPIILGLVIVKWVHKLKDK
jgi:hypothetical protein